MYQIRSGLVSSFVGLDSPCDLKLDPLDGRAPSDGMKDAGIPYNGAFGINEYDLNPELCPNLNHGCRRIGLRRMPLERSIGSIGRFVGFVGCSTKVKNYSLMGKGIQLSRYFSLKSHNGFQWIIGSRVS
jgi:hypothetical protein